MIRFDYLARRIPFKLKIHLARDGCHSSSYVCKQLGLGAEKHVYGKTDAGGYFTPSGKVRTSVYREEVREDDFPSVVALLRACPEVAVKARELYGTTKQKEPAG